MAIERINYIPTNPLFFLEDTQKIVVDNKAIAVDVSFQLGNDLQEVIQNLQKLGFAPTHETNPVECVRHIDKIEEDFIAKQIADLDYQIAQLKNQLEIKKAEMKAIQKELGEMIAERESPKNEMVEIFGTKHLPTEYGDTIKLDFEKFVAYFIVANGYTKLIRLYAKPAEECFRTQNNAKNETALESAEFIRVLK